MEFTINVSGRHLLGLGVLLAVAIGAYWLGSRSSSNEPSNNKPGGQTVGSQKAGESKNTSAGSVGDWRRKAGIAAAMIKNIRQALAEYESDYGVYPGYDRALTYTDTSPLVTMLDGDPSNGGPKKRYMLYRPDDVRDGKLLDPWGDEYHYRVIRDNTTLSPVPTKPDKKYTNGCPDPNRSKWWNIHSFDMWSTAGKSEDPCRYIRNF